MVNKSSCFALLLTIVSVSYASVAQEPAATATTKTECTQKTVEQETPATN